MREAYVLDSFALLAFLEGEGVGQTVLDLFRRTEQGEIRLLMTWVNVGEVAYIVERRRGKGDAYRVLALLDASPVRIVPADRTLTLRAAGIKAAHSITYADTFAAALAMEEQAKVVTGDPEFEKVAGAVDILWLS